MGDRNLFRFSVCLKLELVTATVIGDFNVELLRVRFYE